MRKSVHVTHCRRLYVMELGLMSGGRVLLRSFRAARARAAHG
jgi:hypothetical protein